MYPHSPLPQHKISIHALREEGDVVRDHECRGKNISIHALREEGDLLTSTKYRNGEIISIHALREEGDPSWLRRCAAA